MRHAEDPGGRPRELASRTSPTPLRVEDLATVTIAPLVARRAQWGTDTLEPETTMKKPSTSRQAKYLVTLDFDTLEIANGGGGSDLWAADEEGDGSYGCAVSAARVLSSGPYRPSGMSLSEMQSSLLRAGFRRERM